jgi:hypothetical protein
VAEVSLWLPVPLESSSLETIPKRISYFGNSPICEQTSYLFLGFFLAPPTPFGFPGSLIDWTFGRAAPTRAFVVVRAVLTRAPLRGTIRLEAFP